VRSGYGLDVRAKIEKHKRRVGMKKGVIAVIIAALAIIAIVAAVVMNSKNEESSTVDSNTANTDQNSGSTSEPSRNADQSTSNTQLNNGEALEVEIEDFAFSPATLTIKKGSTVKWTNKDDIGHTATSNDGAFDSGILSKGQTYSFTFNEVGEFAYHCTPHPNMTAKVVVTE
jgi:plastocyanin